MSDSVSVSYKNTVPSVKNYKGLALWRLYVMEFMGTMKCYMSFVLYEYPLSPQTSTKPVVPCWKREDEKTRMHIVSNLGQELETLVNSFVNSGVTFRQVWKNLTMFTRRKIFKQAEYSFEASETGFQGRKQYGEASH